MAHAESRFRYDDVTLTQTPDLVRWGAVVAGVVIGMGFFALFNALWLALAFGAGDGWVSGNLAWFVGVTAAVSLLLAGLVAGMLAGVRGTLAGLVNGVTAWALLFILSFTAIIPGALNLTSTLGAGLQQDVFTAQSAMWTSFWSLLVGLVLAGIGGTTGGKIRRPIMAPEERSRAEPAASTVPPPRTGNGDGAQGPTIVETAPRERQR